MTILGKDLGDPHTHLAEIGVSLGAGAGQGLVGVVEKAPTLIGRGGLA